MPAFLAHYTSGVMAQHRVFDARLDQANRSIIHRSLEEHPGVFHVGLAGPDLFFYAVHAVVFRRLTLGRQMHKYRTGAFLQALYHAAMRETGEDREIALAYFTGFLGHYCQDSSSHPFIYRICDDPSEMKALGKHFRFEAAMDVRCLKHYLGRDINQSYQMGLICMKHHERKVVARVMSLALKEVYPDASCGTSAASLRLTLREYRLITALLIDPTGIKEWIMLGLEKLFPGYPVVSALFINDHLYGTTSEEWERFRRRFSRGEQYFEHLLPLLEDAAEHGEEARFFKAAGSRSYHTGREADGRITEIDWKK